MKLIVGLGNPGNNYVDTRHNVGFMILDQYLKNVNLDVVWSKKFDGLFFKTRINKYEVIFLKPQTYMNLSGECVKKFMDYYDIDVDDLFVISDDLDINLGNFKLKKGGSSGGHNGLKNIETMIGSSMYKRLKIGISNNKNLDTKDYVLSKFNYSEKDILNNTFSSINNIINDYFIFSFDMLMNKYNHKNR